MVATKYDRDLRAYTQDNVDTSLTATTVSVALVGTATTTGYTTEYSIVKSVNRAGHRAIMRGKELKDKRRGVMPPPKGRRAY